MKAAENYGNDRIEKACGKLLSITAQPTLRSITTILKDGQDKLKTESGTHSSSSAKRSNGITRGISTYRGGDEE